MKWLFLGCFSGRTKEAAKPTRRPAQPLAATASPPQSDTVVATSADTSQPSAELQQSQDPCAGGPGLFRPHAGSETKAQAPSGTSNECVDATGGQAQGEAVQRTAPIQKSRSAEQQEAPAPRLSLDCGVGVGPRPPEPPQSAPPPSSELSFARLPPPSAPLALMVRGSVDTGSGDTGAESSFVISDGSSGALTVRGGAAAAALVGPPGDLMVAGSRHVVSRALRGRASLDAMLMLGALVRAADEAGLAVTAIGGTSRLERIESGDLPPGEDGHPDRQTSSRQSRQSRQSEAAAAAAAAVAMPGPRPEWCADAETAGPRLAPRPQRRGMRWQQAALYGSGVSGGAVAAGSSGSGAADAAGAALGFGGGSEAVASHVMSGAAAAVLGRSGDPEFTFSPPTVTNSVRQSVDTSRGQHSDLSLGLLPQAATHLDGQVADSNQVLELFMRLVTNCSTVGDNDLPSTSSGADRSSAGTATCVVTGAGGTTGTGYGSRPVTGTGLALVGGAPVPVSVHRRSHVQRSVSERHRYHNGRRWGGADGGGAAAAGAAGPSHTAAAAAAAAAAGLHSQEGGSSAPLMKLHNRHLMFGGGSAGSGSRRCAAAAASAAGARRNSWDTLAGSSSSAVAVAAAAAAALAAAGLLRGSVASSRNTGGGGGAAGAAGYCSNSGKTATGSASRFWPMGGVLQEDSGPASLLLVGALSGGMSVGGTTSATSLLQLPTGSGSVRDVLSRIHQQQQQQHEGGIPATSSGSWSAQTGLASLFDAHLTAALRRNGAVRTFQRALGGPAALSRASSGVSQQMGNLGRQDTSLSLTSGLMMLNFGSTAGSSGVAGGAGSCNGIGVSHLGAASAAAAAGGLIGSGLMPPRVRRATISSISTIHSSTEAGTAPGGQDHRPGGSCGADGEGDEDIPPAARDAMAGSAMTAPPAMGSTAGYRVPLLSDEGGGAGIQESRAQVQQQQLRAFVERQHPQYPLNSHPARHLQPNSAQAAGTRQQEQAEGPQAKMHSPRGPVLLGSGAAAAAAVPARGARKPSVSGLPSGYEERGSLSLALGLAAGVHGSAGSDVVNTPSGASPAAAAAASPVGNRVGASPPSLPPSPLPETVAAGSLAAGPVGAPWLQPQGPGGALGRGTTGAELSASLDFSRYSWETDWGPPAAGATRGPETSTFTGPSSFSHGQTESAALREAGPDNGGPA